MHRLPPNPNGVQDQSPGSAAHPGNTGTHHARTPTGFNMTTCVTPSGLVWWFCVLTRGALRDPGLCCCTASQSVDSTSRGQRCALHANPKGVQDQSPGSRSAPRERMSCVAREPQRGSTLRCAQRPTEFSIARMCNPFGVGVVVLCVVPGCAARPRAMLFNPLRG
jgi:hypothetical protein